MSALAVGTRVRRLSDGATFEITGTVGRSWTASRLDEFGSPVRLTPRALAGFELIDGGELDDVRPPKVRQEAGEPAFGHDGARIYPLSDGARQLAAWEVEHARRAEPGWTALADLFFSREEAARRDQLDDLHEVVHDEA